MKKKYCLSILAIIMVLLITNIPVKAAVSWPSFSGNKPMKVYTISTGNNTTAYTNSNLNIKKGTIYASDELYILSIGKNSKGVSYAYCTYPVSRGRKDAYIPLSVITAATAPSESGTATTSITVYRRSGSGTTMGTIAKNDKVYRLTASGSRTQVIYNTGSVSNPTGWKMGWISTANYNKYISGTSGNIKTYNPQGCFDSAVSNSNGTVTVRGWAFDRDNLSAQLVIHLYLGGPAGSGAPCYAIRANTYRSDVNNVYSGVGKYHGFSNTIKVDNNKTGQQTIYAYAINVGGGSNIFLGQKNVTIKGTKSYNPQGNFDSGVSQSNGTVKVSGWAFDRDNLNSQLVIHLYVGGPAGSGAPCYAIRANTYRNDVNNVYPGVGKYHGFSNTIKVDKNKTGTQTIYAYAINVGGGSNVLIGKKTVTIKGDSSSQQTANGYIINGVNIGYKAGDFFTDNKKACTDHNRTGIHSYTNEKACNCICTYNGKSLGSVQCFGFARYVQSKLYGVNSYSNASQFYKMSNAYVAPGRLTASKLKTIIKSAKVGAHIRTGGSQHSMIITNITDSGFSIIQCNGQNNKEYKNYQACRIGTYTYTWNSYVSSTYGQRGISFIEMKR